MYKVFADNTLIYDSNIDDYKIAKGTITLEINRSGSFVFSIYPDHFFYDNFIRLKTVITVYKDNKIVFRGRVLNDVIDYWNNKTLTCEGELGFFNDSIIRPFEFSGTPKELFTKFISEHNSQVDSFKRFNIGDVTVEDPNDYIARSNSEYETTSSNMNSRLIEDSLGGYFFITHGDGTDPIPTIHYLANFYSLSKQTIEFGSNLRDYTKTTNAGDIATAIIPLGAPVEDEDSETEDPRLTIVDVNDGVDYVYDESAVFLRGWVTKPIIWEDVTDAENLKKKAQEYLKSVIEQNVTIELKAIDLHLFDKTIESFNIGDYIRVISRPHKFDETLLCNHMELDLLHPENDSLTLGHSFSSFTDRMGKISTPLMNVISMQSKISTVNNRIIAVNQNLSITDKTANDALNNSTLVGEQLNTVAGDITVVAGEVTNNARNIATHDEAIKDIYAKLIEAGIIPEETDETEETGVE